MNGGAGAFFGGKLVVCGGHDGKSALSICYSLQDNKWTKLKDQLQTPRWHAGNAVVNNKLWVTGGLGKDYSIINLIVN